MKLYQFLYDNIPFLSFAVSGYLLIFHQEWGLMVSAAMFYGIGCVILVSRSAVNRLDLESKRKIRHHLPEVAYEYAPYWYGATAIFLIMVFEHPVMQFVAFLLTVIALRNIILRHNNRTKAPSKF